MQLGQAVDRLVEQVRPRMLEAVPARVVGGVAEAEVGALVDDRRARVDQVGDELRRCPVRQREEDRIRGRQLGMDVQVERREVGVDAVDRVPIATTPNEPDQLDIRMPRQQPDQLSADVAGSTDDPDPDHSRFGLGRYILPGDLDRGHWTYDYTQTMHSHARSTREHDWVLCGR